MRVWERADPMRHQYVSILIIWKQPVLSVTLKDSSTMPSLTDTIPSVSYD